MRAIALVQAMTASHTVQHNRCAIHDEACEELDCSSGLLLLTVSETMFALMSGCCSAVQTAQHNR